MRNTSNNKFTLGLVLLSLPAMTIVLSSFSSLQQSDEWNAPESAKQKSNPVPADEASIALGKKVYVKECLSCHGKRVKGDGPSIATLEKSPGNLLLPKVQSQTDGELFWKITEGRKPMPSTKKSLTEEQRWQVVNYIRTLK